MISISFKLKSFEIENDELFLVEATGGNGVVKEYRLYEEDDIKDLFKLLQIKLEG